MQIARDLALAKSGEQLPSGTKWLIEYHASLDMAKELAMVETIGWSSRTRGTKAGLTATRVERS